MIYQLVTILLLLTFNRVMALQNEKAAFAGHCRPAVTAHDIMQYLNIPERPANARQGSAFVDQVRYMNISHRERAVVNEILAGNVPSFSRSLKAITFNKTINEHSYEMIFYALCDYMAIGSDQDYFYIPLTPSTAQYLADSLKCTLPTKKMVDMIYDRAEVKLRPQPIAPASAMTTVPVFWQHSDSIKQQYAQLGLERSSVSIIGGTKKDIIISAKIYSPDRNYERVVIYGWHLSVNNPIQPVYNGHSATYADYSHGLRLVSNMALLNGNSVQVKDIVADAVLWPLFSDEGRISQPWYPPCSFLTSLQRRSQKTPVDVQLYPNYTNPFNPKTRIKYRLSKSSAVDLAIYNMTGQKVMTLIAANQPAGYYAVEWDARTHSSGMYILTLKAGFIEQSRKMIFLP